MSEFHIEDKNLVLKQKNDPDDCKSVLYVDILQGVEEISIWVRGYTADTKEYNSHVIFLEKQQIEELCKFLNDHLNNLDKP